MSLVTELFLEPILTQRALWLASPGLLSLLSYRNQVYQPRDGITHNGLGPSHLITR